MQLINRVFNILMLLSNYPNGITITSLAEKLDLPNSTVHRLLTYLKEESLVVQSQDNKKYYLGYKLFTLTKNLSEKNSLILLAKPFMETLAKELGFTISLNVMQNNIISSIFYIETKDTVRFRIVNGEPISSKASSAGKVILAFSDKEKQKQLYLQDDKNYTENTIQSYDEFLKEMLIIKEKGYAICDEELQNGVQGVAAPLFNSFGKIIGALAYTTLKDSNSTDFKNIIKLIESANQINKSLSGNSKKSRKSDINKRV